jgi:hypothetical protein
MPQLTRKLVNDRPVTWHVHYAGVRVGVIVERSGAPPSSDPWQWCCGFYPGSNPGDDRHGTAADFETARAAFEGAWRDYLPKRSDADFEEWRQDAAWHAAKYARWDRRRAGTNSCPPT